jgi:putative membrane protein
MRPTTQVDLDRISAEVKAAEMQTSGEIYVVIDRGGHVYRVVPLVWAGLVSLILPWPLYLLTDLAFPYILVIQTMAYVAITVLVSQPALHRLMVPETLAAERAHRTAQTQFLAHGIHLTENRTGVLVYVSLFDRRVEIVADAGINKKVAQANWDMLAQQVANAGREGQLSEGLLLAIKQIAKLLAMHFPRLPDDRNELPDHVVEIGSP